MSARNAFEVQFGQLSNKEKVNYAQNFMNKLEENMEEQRKCISRMFDIVVNSKSKDLDEHRFTEELMKLYQRMDKDITESKIRNLRFLKEIELSKINVLTPEMEKGIKDFIDDYENDRFRIQHSTTLYPEMLNEAIFKCDKNIEYMPLVTAIKEKKEKEAVKAVKKEEKIEQIRRKFK